MADGLSMIIGVISALLLTATLLITPLKQDLGVVTATIIKLLAVVICAFGLFFAHYHFQQALIVSIAFLALIIGFVVQKSMIEKN